MTRLIIKLNGVDVSDDCKFEVGQGMGVHRIVHRIRMAGIEEPVQVGTSKFGHILIPYAMEQQGYTHEIVEKPDVDVY